MKPFARGAITLYPTDTSFGLGVRFDDAKGLDALHKLKQRPPGKWFSFMCRDMAALGRFAHVPDGVDEAWFYETPRTAVLRPRAALGASRHWPSGAVAFRVCTVDAVKTALPPVPVTATSANVSGGAPLFDTAKMPPSFIGQVVVFDPIGSLEKRPSSQIWDFTKGAPMRIR